MGVDLPGRFCGSGSRCGQSSSDRTLPRGGRAAGGPGREADRLLDTRHAGSVSGAAVIVTASSPAVAGGAAGCGCPGYHPGGSSASATARRPGSGAPSCAARPAWASRIRPACDYGPAYGSAAISFGRIMREDLRPCRGELVISARPAMTCCAAGRAGAGSPVPPIAALNTNIRNPVKPGMPVRRSPSRAVAGEEHGAGAGGSPDQVQRNDQLTCAARGGGAVRSPVARAGPGGEVSRPGQGG